MDTKVVVTREFSLGQMAQFAAICGVIASIWLGWNTENRRAEEEVKEYRANLEAWQRLVDGRLIAIEAGAAVTKRDLELLSGAVTDLSKVVSGIGLTQAERTSNFREIFDRLTRLEGGGSR